MTAIIEDPIQLRSKILVWAITTNVTDLIETMPPLGDYTSGVFHFLNHYGKFTFILDKQEHRLHYHVWLFINANYYHQAKKDSKSNSWDHPKKIIAGLIIFENVALNNFSGLSS